MKKIFYAFVCCLTLSLAVNAQSKDEQQIAAAVEKLKKAIVNADKQQLEALTAAELSYGHSSGKIEDKAAFVEALTSGTSDFEKIDLADQTIKIVDNTALVRHQLTGILNTAGTKSAVKLGVLLVWQKQKGTWKLLARQAFKL